MQNALKSEIQEIDSKLYAQIPSEVGEQLDIKLGDFIEFGIAGSVTLWKSQQIDVPEEVFQPLLKTFKTPNYAFQWLNRKQR